MKLSRAHLILAACLLLLVILVVVFQQLDRDTQTPDDASVPSRSTEDSRTRSEPAPWTRHQERTRSRDVDRQLAAEGVATDMSLAEFPRHAYQRMPVPTAKPAGGPVGDAYIHIPSSGRRVAVEANQIGEYPTMEAKTNETVGVRLSLDAVKSGTPVRVVILDGGGFPSAQGVTQVLEAGKGGSLGFEFTVSPNTGFHRILVQAQGQPSRILNFDAVDG